MDTDRLNRWLTLLANIGVVIGLVLIIVELRQNQEMMEFDHTLTLIEADHTEIEYLANLRQSRIEDPELMRIFVDGYSGKPLPEMDQMRFEAMCTNHEWAAAMMYRRSERLDRVAFKDGIVESHARALLSSPGARTCWEGMRFEIWGYDDWVEAVNKRVVEKQLAGSGVQSQ